MILRGLIAGGALAALGSAAGAGPLPPEEARARCAPLMSVVKDSCEIENYYSCEGGATYSEAHAEGAAPVSSWTSADFSESYRIDASGMGYVERLESRDPFSIAALLETGADRSETVDRLELGDGGFYTATVTYDIRLTGATRRLGGHDFLVAAAEMAASFGGLFEDMGGRGSYLVEPDLGLLVFGWIETSYPAVTRTGGEPVAVLVPGDAGFMADAAPESCRTPLSKGVTG